MTATGAIRDLALLLRSGLSLRKAAEAWPLHSDDPTGAIAVVSRRIRLGAPVPDAIASLSGVLGADADRVARILRIAIEMGGDVAAILEAFATSIDERNDARRVAHAHVAGVRLSAKLVGALPLLFLPMTPISRAALTDGAGLLLLAAGIALAWAGMRWIDRLVPSPPDRADDTEVFTLITGAVIAGGVAPRAAMDACSVHGGAELRRARRRVRLGLPWHAALSRSSDPGLSALGRHLATIERLGLPPVEALAAFRRARRQAEVAAFEAEVRRAPVRMVVPLTTCVLPAFALLGAGPFVRSALGL